MTFYQMIVNKIVILNYFGFLNLYKGKFAFWNVRFFGNTMYVRNENIGTNSSKVLGVFYGSRYQIS